MPGKLELTFNANKLGEFILDKEVLTIGRKEDNDICIDNLAVSGHHAKLLTIFDDSFLEDMESTNGTFVNEQRVNRLPLTNGQQITIGKHNLQVAIDGGDQARQAALGDTTMALDTEEQRKRLNKQ